MPTIIKEDDFPCVFASSDEEMPPWQDCSLDTEDDEHQTPPTSPTLPSEEEDLPPAWRDCDWHWADDVPSEDSQY